MTSSTPKQNFWQVYTINQSSNPSGMLLSRFLKIQQNSDFLWRKNKVWTKLILSLTKAILLQRYILQRLGLAVKQYTFQVSLMIHQPWLKSIFSVLDEAAQEKNIVLKIDIFHDQFTLPRWEHWLKTFRSWWSLFFLSFSNIRLFLHYFANDQTRAP